MHTIHYHTIPYHNTTQHNTTVHYITLHFVTLHYITSHHITYIHTYNHTLHTYIYIYIYIIYIHTIIHYIHTYIYIYIIYIHAIRYKSYKSKCGHYPTGINLEHLESRLDPSDPCCGHWLQQLPHRYMWWQPVGAAILSLVYAMEHWEIHL